MLCEGKVLHWSSYKGKIVPILELYNSVCPRFWKEMELSRVRQLRVRRVGPLGSWRMGLVGKVVPLVRFTGWESEGNGPCPKATQLSH